MKKQNGITLVALVITIIVLLILAMVSIRIVMDGGLTQKAKDATAQHTIGAEKEAITTGYAAYQIELAQKGTADLKVKGETTVTPKGEDWSVTFTKTNNEYELKKDGTITLTKQGNGSTTTVGWKDNGDDTFTKGDVTVKLGDIVNYDEGTGYSTTVEASKSGYESNPTYTTENLNWRVLGISAKGELELISDNPTSKELYLEGELGYLNAEEVLNNMCNELYGKGKHATGARSLKVEDVDTLANYDKTTYSGYGVEWQYRYPTQEEADKANGTENSTRYMQYSKNGTDWTNITSSAYQQFKYPGKAVINSSNPGTRAVKHTYYEYPVQNKIANTMSTDIANMITKGTTSSNINQWLSSRCVYCDRDQVAFGVRSLTDGKVYGSNDLLRSGIGAFPRGQRVRPVVSLESDIQLSGSSNDRWTIN